MIKDRITSEAWGLGHEGTRAWLMPEAKGSSKRRMLAVEPNPCLQLEGSFYPAEHYPHDRPALSKLKTMNSLH